MLPERYSYQFSLRQTLFGEIACAIDKKYNRRVAIKFSYKDRQLISDGEDPSTEVQIFREFASNLSRDPSNASFSSASSVDSKGSIDSILPRFSTINFSESTVDVASLATTVKSSSNFCATTSTAASLSSSHTTTASSSSNIIRSNSEQTLTESSDHWHPNVIRFYHSGEDSHKLFTVMEFAHRGELLDHITNSPNGRLSEADAARIIEQTARGLQFCHDNGYAHLDVSPENILLTRKWEAKLCDFGLAKRMDVDGIVHRTHSTGKANYMAPEAYATKGDRRRRGSSNAAAVLNEVSSSRKSHSPGKFAGAPADVFSLGIVMFLSITGVLPYQYPQKSDRRFVLVTGGKRNLSGLLRRWGIKISDAALNLLAKMLAEDPLNRASIQDILHSDWVLYSLREPSILLSTA
mmetsp:Transcript_9103/g.12632  ORF Transcript_9103/g.12632 Transcript_9103/m.12632 type:complete len:408 (+) Transcript_9103:275-1498(+)